MYGRFLKEAAQITGERGLEAMGREMFAIGDQWQEVARLLEALAASADAPAGLPEVAGRLNGIADQEEAAWQRLQALA